VYGGPLLTVFAELYDDFAAKYAWATLDEGLNLHVWNLPVAPRTIAEGIV
jgi:hypothetical protein